MAASTRSAAVVACVAVLAACAGRTGPQPELIRHYRCDDGTTFSAEIQPAAVRLYTVTGTIELPRRRGDGVAYTNGLRTIVIGDDGSVRHATGRRAWTECRAER